MTSTAIKKYGRGNPPPVKTFWTVEKVRPALIAARGIYAEAARVLTNAYDRKCHRATVANLVRKHPDLEAIAREAFEATLEGLHSATIEAAERGDQKDRHLLLTRWHPGYKNKQEITGPDGGPLQFMAAPQQRTMADVLLEGIDENLLSRDEQIELSRLCEIIDVGGGFTALSVRDFERVQVLVNKAKGKEVLAIEDNTADVTMQDDVIVPSPDGGES